MIKKIFLGIIIIFIITFIIYSSSINSSFGDGEEQAFIIEKGQGVSLIAENLKEENLIKSIFFFKLYVKISDQQASFKDGSYVLSPKMNIKQIVSELTPKVFLKPEEQITFIEGWSIKDYVKALEEKELIDSDRFISLSGESLLDYRESTNDYPKDYSEEFAFLKDKPSYYGLEGYLFPDTYRFFTDSSENDIIRRMLSNFDKKLTEKMRADIFSQGKTIHEIITMASIIEKEVQNQDDMKIVSGIFWNRIKGSQALESCATLAYILGVNKAQYSYEDTRTPSSFNTYINRGLPPAPISNPGLRAIEAAIYPEKNDYNYFLTSTETGETIFSRTYEEHLINKNKYIK
jgi:UPF0755 protein